MGKTVGALRTILVPSVLVAVSATVTSSSWTSARSQDAVRRDASKRATAIALLVPVAEAQRVALHQATATWHKTLDRPTERPPSEAGLLNRRFDALGKAIRRSGRTDIDLSSISTNLAEFASTRDLKAKNRTINLVAGELTELASKLQRRSDDERELAEIQDLFGSLVGFAEGDASVASIRAGVGVDPLPTNASVRGYVNAMTAASSSSAEPSLSTRELLGIGSGTLGDRLEKIFTSGSGRVLLDESVWAFGSRSPTYSNASFEDLAASTHAALDEASALLTDGIDELVGRANASLAAAQRTQRLLQMLAFAGVAALLASAAALLRRVSRTLRSWRQASESDDLTALLNRAGLRSAVSPWFTSENRAIGLAVVDLDHFKRVNDTYGHESGDRLLVATGQRLRSQVVASRTAVARWGGDEFVLVFRLDRGASYEDLGGVLRRIQSALVEPFDLGRAMVIPSASIGAAVCECGTCDLDDLFRAADHGLYDVKRSGRNNVALLRCSRHDGHESATASDVLVHG